MSTAVTVQPSGIVLQQQQQSKSPLSNLTSVSSLIIATDKEQHLQDWFFAPLHYQIFDNETKELLYKVEEYVSCCCSLFCGPSRNSKFSLLSMEGEWIATFKRAPFRCDCCCCLDCFLCKDAMSVFLGDKFVGKVRQRLSVWRPKLAVYEGEEQDRVADIKGPCCPCRCAFSMEFTVNKIEDELEGGAVRKHYAPSEIINTDHETIILEFDKNSSVKRKLLYIAAAYLTNLMYMEVS